MSLIFRLLLILLVVGAVYWLIIAIGRRLKPGRRRSPPSTPKVMVSCAVCGTHLPQDLALYQHGQAYCCTAHRDQPPSLGE